MAQEYRKPCMTLVLLYEMRYKVESVPGDLAFF